MLSSASFFFKDTATTEIYTLSLHDALPIWAGPRGYRPPPTRAAGDRGRNSAKPRPRARRRCRRKARAPRLRSEEHTSELQSRRDLVCRLLLEKKKNNKKK